MTAQVQKSNIPKSIILKLCKLYAVTPNYLLLDEENTLNIEESKLLYEGDLKIFESQEFGEIRTLTIDGEPWFVGKDIADVLGYLGVKSVSY